ncbi:MAG: phage integrase SAM-like domain-containing protein [Cyclobacteriaceae bacterium]|nr:phage integrase SAM-like domain-containing protein [Cyclobacteriaceae bacterium]
MKIRFLLKKKAGQGSSGLIYVALYFKDQAELISTGQRIHKSDWSPVDQFPKDHRGEVAKAITEVKSRISKAITRLEAQEEIVTPFSVKQEFNRFESERITKKLASDKKQKADNKSVKSLVNDWLENSLFHYEPSTQKAVRESMKQFLEFLTKSGNGGIERGDLNESIITAYERYLQEKRKLANSTHGKRMKHLRWFLKTLGYDVNTIKIRTGKKEIIALSDKEVEQLEQVDVNDSSELQKAKDIFLLGVYTGLRISDLKRVNETRIIDGKIRMTLQKNDKEVTIPLLAKARKIIERHGNRSPRISEQALNRAIKTVCQKAGIVTRLTIRVNIAGRDTDKEEPKYKLITSHTAGKTFISLAPQWFGLSPAEVAAIVGKDLKTVLNHYYKLPLESAIIKIESHEQN